MNTGSHNTSEVLKAIQLSLADEVVIEEEEDEDKLLERAIALSLN